MPDSGFTFLDFEFNRLRSADPQTIYGPSGASFRWGKPNARGNVEDNSLIARLPELTRQQAEALLARINNGVRSLANPSPKDRAGAAAAHYVEIPEGIAYRSAGDALIMAMGPDGKVHILNKLQISAAGGQYIGNAVVPGEVPTIPDDNGFASRKSIAAKVGEPFVMLTVTDGLYGDIDGGPVRPGESVEARAERVKADVERYVTRLAQANGLSSNDPELVRKLGQAAMATPEFRGKPDDINISQGRRAVPGSSILNVMWDGMGGHGNGDVVAFRGVEVAKIAAEEAAGTPIRRIASERPSDYPEGRAHSSANPTASRPISPPR